MFRPCVESWNTTRFIIAANCLLPKQDTVKLPEQTLTNQLLPGARWPYFCTPALLQEFFLSCLSNQLCFRLNFKILLSMFPTLDFPDSGSHKNWLEKYFLLNKESNIPKATICINRKPFLSLSVRLSVLEESHPSSFVVQVTQSPIEFIPIMKNILFSFGDDGSTFGPIQGKTIVTQNYSAIDFTDQSSGWHIYNFRNINSLWAFAWFEACTANECALHYWKTQLFS